MDPSFLNVVCKLRAVKGHAELNGAVGSGSRNPEPQIARGPESQRSEEDELP